VTPLVIIVLGEQPIVAVGTDRPDTAITRAVGGWRHLRTVTVQMRSVGRLAGTGVSPAVLGVSLVDARHGRAGFRVPMGAVLGAPVMAGAPGALADRAGLRSARRRSGRPVGGAVAAVGGVR
jgi:uncharacterized membrane protein YfcA